MRLLEFGAALRVFVLSVAVGGGASVAHAVEHQVPLFIRAAHETQQGFVRIINRSNQAGNVRVTAIDDEGMAFDPFTLSMAAWETRHFNSNHLENGDADRGLPGVGRGNGDWRLLLDSDLDLEVLAYVRTHDGFLTAMHDTAAKPAETYVVPIFNPGSNTRQVSKLRIINPSDGAASVVVNGVDDGGEVSEAVSLTVPAGAARTFTALDLEQGHRQLDGRLGDGAGKWSLFASSERDIVVMSLLEGATGHLTNLSTTTAAGDRAIPGQVSTTYTYNDLFALDGGTLKRPAGIAHARGRLYLLNRSSTTIGTQVGRSGVFVYTLGGRKTASEDFLLDDFADEVGALTYGRDRLLIRKQACEVAVDAYTTSGERDPAGGFRSTVGCADGIAHAGDRVYAFSSSRVYAFTTSGRRMVDWEFRLDQQNRESTGAVHVNGRLYVVDAADYKVYAYLPDGSRDEAADFPLFEGNNDPVGIAYASSTGSFYVLDRATFSVFSYAAN